MFYSNADPTIVITSTNLHIVKHLIWEARAKWKHLALVLDIPFDTVEDIRYDSHCKSAGDRLEKVLHEWISGGAATIHHLIIALNNRTVGCGSVLRELRSTIGEEREKLGFCKTNCTLCSNCV